MAAYADKFASLGVKLLGLSADDVASHRAWIKDIEAYCNGCKVTYPIAADPHRRVIKELNMVDPDEKDAGGNPVPSPLREIEKPRESRNLIGSPNFRQSVTNQIGKETPMALVGKKPRRFRK